jgi:hypothetical protein
MSNALPNCIYSSTLILILLGHPGCLESFLLRSAGIWGCLNLSTSVHTRHVLSICAQHKPVYDYDSLSGSVEALYPHIFLDDSPDITTQMSPDNGQAIVIRQDFPNCSEVHIPTLHWSLL